MSKLLFSSYELGSFSLENRMVLAPMTRCRAIGGLANELMAEYYAQRAGLGLLISEGTAPSANALGYARIPGMYNEAQMQSWKPVVEAVHAKGSKFVLQLMHVGRVAHKDNMPEGSRIVAPSAVQLSGEMWTDAKGPLPHSPAEEMSKEDISQAIAEFVQSAKYAVEAGFDAVEIHAANGYLIEQFLCQEANKRSDNYGGSDANRMRFCLEVVDAVVKAIGPERVGIRLSPFGVFNSIKGYSQDFAFALTEQLSVRKLLYVHIVNHEAMGAPAVPQDCVAGMRQRFAGSFILSGGFFSADAAEEKLQNKEGDLVAFGRAALANPDLPQRFEQGAALNEADMSTFYSADEKGYTDYSFLS